MTIEEARNIMPKLKKLTDSEVIAFLQETDNVLDAIIEVIEKERVK